MIDGFFPGTGLGTPQYHSPGYFFHPGRAQPDSNHEPAGNGAVLKHASNVQGCANAIESCFIDAGYYENIFSNLRIPGNRVDTVIENPNIAAVTLTGSTPAGKAVGRKAGESLKKTILELLVRLQRERGLGILFISHDLDVVRDIADFIVVMKDGAIVEQGKCSEVLENPSHPYTKSLLEAAPTINSDNKKKLKQYLLYCLEDQSNIWFLGSLFGIGLCYTGLGRIIYEASSSINLWYYVFRCVIPYHRNR